MFWIRRPRSFQLIEANHILAKIFALGVSSVSCIKLAWDELEELLLLPIVITAHELQLTQIEAAMSAPRAALALARAYPSQGKANWCKVLYHFHCETYVTLAACYSCGTLEEQLRADNSFVE